MKPSDVRDKTVEELAKIAGELTEEIFRLRFRNATGQLKQTSNIGKARRDLARVNTIMRERQSAPAKGGA